MGRSRTSRIAGVLTVVLMSVLGIAAQPAGPQSRPGEHNPTRVEVDLFLVDLSAIDSAAQTFTADVYLVAQWSDPRLAADVEESRLMPLDSLWSPRFEIFNRRDVTVTASDVVEVAPDGTVVFRQRFIGDFTNVLHLGDFPFDSHQLRFLLVTPGISPDELDLVPRTVAEKGSRAPNLSIPDWEIGVLTTGPSSFEVIPGVREVAGFELTLEVERRIGFYVGKAFASVTLIVMMSWVVFWMPRSAIAPRVSVSVTAMLTLIAYRFLLGGVLPPVSYLTRMDWFLLGSTALVFLSLIGVVVIMRLTNNEREAAASRAERLSRLIFPFAYVLLAVLVVIAP